MLPEALAGWFAARGWRVRRHQTQMLEAAQAGRDALLVADTGAGKTWPVSAHAGRCGGRADRGGLHTIYVSPLKALARDVRRVDDAGRGSGSAFAD
jgi:ATP-dependent Lhr-like helicase